MKNLENFTATNHSGYTAYTTTYKNHRAAFVIFQDVTAPGAEFYLQLPEENENDVDSICDKYENFLSGEIFCCEACFPWESPFQEENRNVVLGWVNFRLQSSSPVQEAASLLTGTLEKIFG